MGNAFAAVLKNEAPRGRDMTYEDRNYKVSHNTNTTLREKRKRTSEHGRRKRGYAGDLTPPTSGITSPLKLLSSKMPSPPLPLEVDPLEVRPVKPAIGGQGLRGSAVSSPSGVWGEAPAANDFGAF